MRLKGHIAPVWLGKYIMERYMYLEIYRDFSLHRLGEACCHIAAVLSCLVRGTEMRSKSGVESCTSQPCAWLPPARNVGCF